MDFQKKTSFHWISYVKFSVSSNAWFLPSMCCLATADDFSTEFLCGRHWLPPGTGASRASDCLCAWLCLCASLLRFLHFLCLCLAGWLSASMVVCLARWVAPVSVPVSGPGLCELQIQILKLTTIFGIAKVPADASESCCFMTFVAVLAVHHTYVWPWAHFLDFSTSFFFDFFFRLSHGGNTLENFV